MFWSKSPLVNTVKFKIALLCAILYVLSMIVCALIVYSGKYDAVSRRMDPIITGNLDAAEFEYLSGQRLIGSIERIPKEELPRAAVADARKTLPGFTALVGYRQTENDPVTLVGLDRGKLKMIRPGHWRSQIRELNAAEHLEILQRSFDDRAEVAGYDLVRSRVLTPDGKELVTAKLPRGAVASERLYRNFRSLRRTLYDGNVIEIGYSRTPFQNQFGYYSERLLLVLLVLPVLGFFSGWVAADRLLAGVRKVTAAARRIAGGDFSQRVAQPGVGAEIDELVSTFNMMNANTEELFNQLRTVTDDVAHDLRTPITRIRGEAEVTIRGPQNLAAYREALGAIAEECDDMVAMINTMLEIARTESRLAAPKSDAVDLRELLARAFDIFQVSAEENAMTWQAELPDHPVAFRGDKLQLQRMVANLLDNAVKFSPGCAFTLKLEETPQALVISAADTGPGIPDASKPRIFDRFYRLDSSRTKRGNGLGLAMTRAIARAHGGDIAVSDTPGGGATFTVTLPRPAETAKP